MKQRIAVALLAGSFFLNSSLAFDKPDASDDRIYDQVRMRLTGDQDVKGGALTVVVKNGEVTLTGRVDNERGKSKATKLAKKVKGVKSVDNELSVGPPR